MPLSPGEKFNGSLALILSASRIPLFVKQLAAWALRRFSSPAGRNDVFADMLELMHPQTAVRERELSVMLEDYRARWYSYVKTQGIDFVLSVPCALPSLPKDGSDSLPLLAANYGVFYNIVRSFHVPC